MGKLKIGLIFLFAANSFYLQGQHTFSIVAVDTITGEIGSAGATCLDLVEEGASALIISDIIQGKGAIHTQAAYTLANQSTARSRMEFGFPPQSIIDHLVSNDAGGNSSIRQYGIVDIDNNGHPRTAAFTGNNCFDYKGHRLGVNYSIQGNILIGPQVLDSMEARFIATEGSLATKLMAAMQGANIPGADERCLDEGVSSRSSFLRVSHPDLDNGSQLYLDLHVGVTPFAVEPIDSLQSLFDAWLLTDIDELDKVNHNYYRVAQNPTNSSWKLLDISLLENTHYLEIMDLQGQVLRHLALNQGMSVLEIEAPVVSGIYFLQLRAPNGQILAVNKLLKL